MSTSFNIKFLFDKKELNNLDKMLSWISDHSASPVPWKSDKSKLPGKYVEIKFRDNLIKKFNFTHHFEEAKLDFSKGIPEDNRLDVSFIVKKDKNLVRNLIEWGRYKKENLEEIEKNFKPGYLDLGYFYLGIIFQKVYGRLEDEFELDFWAAAYSLGDAFMRSHSSRKIFIDFCKKFNPKEAYIEIEDQKDEVFWPLK